MIASYTADTNIVGVSSSAYRGFSGDFDSTDLGYR